MLNRTTIMGRLTADVELRKTQSGTPVAAFTVAVERDFKGQNGEKETDFINCVAWKHTAEFITKYFKKGSMAVISGRLQTRNYDGNDGKKVYITEVIADSVYFGESKKTEVSDVVSYTPEEAKDVFNQIDDDDELPFF